jgi:hypothetical protein
VGRTSGTIKVHYSTKLGGGTESRKRPRLMKGLSIEIIL